MSASISAALRFVIPLKAHNCPRLRSTSQSHCCFICSAERDHRRGGCVVCPAVPDAHVGRPEQVAAAAAFLLSPDSAHIAFHDLYIDGGETLGI